MLRNLMFAKVLYHEIGHHVQVISNSKLLKKEAFADKYAARLIKRFLQQNYRYLRPFVPFLLRLINPMLRLIRIIENLNKPSEKKIE